ncbi:MAG: dihydroorotase [Bacteroidetes bacterium]|nr:dihydroorotase [Bacteroidota bacterium]
MAVIIRSAKIISSASESNGQTADILIIDGKITEIGKGLKAPEDAEIIEAEGLCVSPGWFDMHVNFRDPGFEWKEDLSTGRDSAAAGGFTGVAVMPSTLPPVHSKSEIEYIINKSRGFIVDILPVGTVSKNLEGKDLSEMYDMHLSGAIAFSDDKKSIADPGLLQRALLYSKSFNGLIINFPDEQKISLDGKMNEGITSTHTGLKGMPALAEDIMAQRDIFLVEYTESRIHFSTISSAKTVDLIRKAKKQGLNITAEVAVHNLFFDDTVLEGFESHFKVKPPLRTKEDITALLEGIADGTIDAIVSDHSPEDEEMKKREFDYAAFGAIGLETAFAAANTALKGKISLEKLIDILAINPRKILNLPIPAIKIGEKANLTCFLPKKKWEVTESDLKSKSKNCPFIGLTLTGKAVAVVNNGSFVRLSDSRIV